MWLWVDGVGGIRWADYERWFKSLNRRRRRRRRRRRKEEEEEEEEEEDQRLYTRFNNPPERHKSRF